MYVSDKSVVNSSPTKSKPTPTANGAIRSA